MKLPPTASHSADDLWEMPPMGACFTISFMLPFERADVFEQLLGSPSTNVPPLGSSSLVEFTLMRPGYDKRDEMSAGCVRRAAFAAPAYGEVISELTVAERGDPNDAEGGVSELVWRQLSSSTNLNLVGDGHYLPEFGVTLEGNPGGTVCTLRYNFAKAEMGGPLCCLGCMMPTLLKWNLQSSIDSVWYKDMISRGYQAVRRPFVHRTRDLDEERQIRERALTPRQQPSSPGADVILEAIPQYSSRQYDESEYDPYHQRQSQRSYRSESSDHRELSTGRSGVDDRIESSRYGSARSRGSSAISHGSARSSDRRYGT